MTVDLHLHTNHSDGTWSVEEMVEYAVKMKMSHIAITDHDTTSGIALGIQAAAGRLEIIPGVEINTRAETGVKKSDIHILGYFIDAANPDLNALLSRQRDARLNHVLAVIEKLNDSGIKLTMEAILEFTEGGPIGKAHITKAIVAVGGAPDIMQAYEKYMSKSSSFYVPRQSVTPEEAIDAIRRAGGIASIAHPGKGERAANKIKELIPCGLQAIEVYHQSHSRQTVQKLIRLANKHALLITGGSDCHGPYEDCPPSLGTVSVPMEVVTKLTTFATRPSQIQSQPLLLPLLD